ncbi:hypothetical protein VTN49DRAFT_7256 [Thermomyces lanuginosus]|uniref:uncharacterized protein n=1 Tax=Thermomyces lanuginosus TaxID=5541 RepID=UPI0037439374
MIEPAWNWLKRRTTARGAPKKREDAIRAWKQAWKDLDQRGNEYKEGKTGEDERPTKGRYKKGDLSQRVYYDDARKRVGTQVYRKKGGGPEQELGEDGFEDLGDNDEGGEEGDKNMEWAGLISAKDAFVTVTWLYCTVIK